MVVIKVPKPPKRAFDKSRPASKLLQAQIEHLEAAAGIYHDPKRKRRKPISEGEAAAHIGTLTRQLHPQAAAPQARPDTAPVPAAEAPVARRSPSKPALPRKKKKSSKSSKRSARKAR